MHLSKTISALLLSITMAVSASAQEQQADSTGLPGDNFSLQGALDLFKKAGSPEEFEKLLNSQDNKVNNLDLNGDGQIDYVRVTGKKQDNVQIFVLQALVSANESQDVAVISLEKTAENNAVIQIEGDADIYGESTIAEPLPEAENAFNDSPASHGPSVSSPDGIIVNVWFWPCVRFVYAPAYTVWVSPFTWVAHPVWWRPWRPMPYYEYRPYCVHYNTRYVVVPTRRIPPARFMYRPTRVTSVTVIQRNRIVVNNYRNGRLDNRGGYRMDDRQSNYGGNRGGGYAPNRTYNDGGRYNNGNYQPSRTYNSGGRTGNYGGGNNNYQPGRTYNGGGNRTAVGNNNGGSRQSGGGYGGGRTYNNGGGRGGRAARN
ncbi:hypothetical protein [Chitinophaga sp.]|uniref:hypothetical protein n=1 Tax=Chitinophaga sp. TaxID=1869181 RepID=UPI0031E1D621